MAIFPSTAIPSAATGYEIPYSCRFDAASTSYMTWTPAGAGNRKTWTFSAWVKRGNIDSRQIIFASSSDGNTEAWLAFEGDDKLWWKDMVTSSYNYSLKTNSLFRDTGAWYHILITWDTPQDSASDRMKLYVNGVQETSFSTDDYPAEDFDGRINNNVEHTIGRASSAYPNYNDGYLAEVHFIDGTALTPTSFGQEGDYGEWEPIEVEGLTYGTNGFYLDFADSADLGDDESGEGNDWTENNITAADQMLDSPTNNFATLNPINPISTGKTLSEGNLKVSGSTINQVGANGTIYINSSGKWYAEVVMTANAGGQPMIGLNDGTNTLGNRGLIFYNDGRKGTNGGYVTYGSNTSWTTGDIMGIAYNGDDNSGECTLYKNNTSLGVAYTGLNSTLGDTFTFTCQNNATGTTTFVWNFGQDSSFAGEKTAQGNQDGNSIGDFYYTPPTGFLALCTSNLPAVAVVPSANFNTVLWTGDGSTKSITGVGFQPDLVWGKNRVEAWNNTLFDAVRGTGKLLQSNLSNAETNNDVWGYLSAFNSDGFTLTAGSSGIDQVNDNSDAYVAWNWKANGSGSANTVGDIDSTVSVNTDAGFSIVSYEGSGSAETVGHGLGVIPEIVIIKNRERSAQWMVYHEDIGATKFVELSTTAAESTDAAFNDTAPTATVFSVGGSSNATNASGEDLIAYCFHSVDGYSKVGSYEGNADDDGTFVYTGFRPEMIIIKNIDAVQNWYTFDSARDALNPITNPLSPNSSGTEDTASCDFLSNGFKMRDDDAAWNGANTYIYIAFAETPFKYSNAR